MFSNLGESCCHCSTTPVTRLSEHVGDAKDTQQVVFGADQNMVDIAPVGFCVDVDFPTDEPGRFHCLADWEFRRLNFGSVQVCHSLTKRLPTEDTNNPSLSVHDGYLGVATVHHSLDCIAGESFVF